MAEFQFKTKGNADPHGRPRVYFTCHPGDFNSYFERICNDIFADHEPAIYYTADMTEALDKTNIDVDLGRMNLFVVPITLKLLNESNRAMQVDIAYAKEHNIPILPFMMESGIDVIYSLPKNFGELQYLNPNSTDATEVSYKDKLKKYLESTLISDEMSDRIRAAFDAYIFLSYRKKDRGYANELMRIIHNIPMCRDIAIWYDEFLTPGESFMKNIERAMKNSKLFALLVTPNLLEYVERDGKLVPNFVMDKEYPAARTAGMDILPTEMEKTDYQRLKTEYDGIPVPVATDDSCFTKTLLGVIEKIAISENDKDSEHNFLIGLAYFEGIDVENNVERGMELITSSAEAGLPEAMEKLYNIYSTGDRVPIDYREALKWAERLSDFYRLQDGEDSKKSLYFLNNVAHTHNILGNYDTALDIYNRIYELESDADEDDPNRLMSLSNIAYTYGKQGKYKEALKRKKKVYNLSCEIYGAKNANTIKFLGNLASAYGRCAVAYGDDEYSRQSLNLKEKAYKMSCKVNGEQNGDTLKFLNNLAGAYYDLKMYKPALNLYDKGYALSKQINGPHHTDTLMYLANLGSTYGGLENYDLALSLGNQAYELRCEVIGAEHPDTIASMNNLSGAYMGLKKEDKAIELLDDAYKLQTRILGAEHPNTLTILMNLTIACYLNGKYPKYLYLIETLYPLAKKTWNPTHPHMTTIKQLYKRITGKNG